MKYISSLFLLISITLLSGCGGSSPEPYKMVKPKVAKSGSLQIRIYGDIGATDLENTAIVLTEVSKKFKAQGLNYFRITPAKNIANGGIKDIIVNMNDLIDYCYPSFYKSSSLEDKCELTNPNGKVRYIFTGVPDSKMKLGYFYWSVDQVLADPLVKKYYDSGLKEFKDKTIKYEFIKGSKMIKKLKS